MWIEEGGNTKGAAIRIWATCLCNLLQDSWAWYLTYYSHLGIDASGHPQSYYSAHTDQLGITRTSNVLQIVQQQSRSCSQREVFVFCFLFFFWQWLCSQTLERSVILQLSLHVGFVFAPLDLLGWQSPWRRAVCTVASLDGELSPALTSPQTGSLPVTCKWVRVAHWNGGCVASKIRKSHRALCMALWKVMQGQWGVFHFGGDLATCSKPLNLQTPERRYIQEFLRGLYPPSGIISIPSVRFSLSFYLAWYCMFSSFIQKRLFLYFCFQIFNSFYLLELFKIESTNICWMLIMCQTWGWETLVLV